MQQNEDICLGWTKAGQQCTRRIASDVLFCNKHKSQVDSNPGLALLDPVNSSDPDNIIDNEEYLIGEDQMLVADVGVLSGSDWSNDWVDRKIKDATERGKGLI